MIEDNARCIYAGTGGNGRVYAITDAGGQRPRRVVVATPAGMFPPEYRNTLLLARKGSGPQSPGLRSTG